MDIEGYLNDLRRSAFFKGQIAHIERIPSRTALYGELEKPLHPDLESALQRGGLKRLYCHQAQAVNAARNGHNVTIVTATASGKTLCYNLPVLNEVLEDPHARALYLFPTKALAQDQLGKLNGFGLFPAVRFANYDGDTPQDERRAVRQAAQIVLTNPDMLHVGILPRHSAWARFFRNLRYVVIDEMHVYRGVFGAHMALILRRLRRLCRHYGSNPQFLCCSATIANPAELTEKLTGIAGPLLVEKNGAPSGPRAFVFWNPPFVGEDHTGRRSANMEATSLFTDLITQGVRTIAFARARRSAELILRYARTALEERAPHYAKRIASYRSGYTIKERRALEDALFTGRLLGIASTNALELGVDVGGLEASILTGYPGSVAAAWQQAGRAGRDGEPSVSLMVAFDSPLDQFLMRHPDYFFARPHERAIVDPNNRRILQAHLLCAAYERGLDEADRKAFGPEAEKCARTLLEEGDLSYRGGRYLFNRGDYPAASVPIRSASRSAFQIVDQDGKLIGSVEENDAYRTVHPGAVYLHQGETFVVEELDREAHRAWVRPIEATYYTEAGESSRLQVLDTKAAREHGSAKACFGEVVVSSRVNSYQRKRLYSDQVVQVEFLDLPEQTFETEALWITVPFSISRQLLEEGADLYGSLHAAEHALNGMAPLICSCDRYDVGAVSHLEHPDTALPTLFLYDNHPGGVGLAAAAFQALPELLKTAHALLQQCACKEGCPSCIHSSRCGSNNQALEKRGAQRLLELLQAEIPEEAEA